MSPLGVPVRRELTPEQAEADLKTVQSMWEMASALDFLRRFRCAWELSFELALPYECLLTIFPSASQLAGFMLAQLIGCLCAMPSWHL